MRDSNQNDDEDEDQCQGEKRWVRDDLKPGLISTWPQSNYIGTIFPPKIGLSIEQTNILLIYQMVYLIGEKVNSKFIQ